MAKPKPVVEEKPPVAPVELIDPLAPEGVDGAPVDLASDSTDPLRGYLCSIGKMPPGVSSADAAKALIESLLTENQQLQEKASDWEASYNNLFLAVQAAGAQAIEAESIVSGYEIEGLTCADFYKEFVSFVEGNFPAWDALPGETRRTYEACAKRVVEGHEPRTGFERVVARMLIEATPAEFDASRRNAD